MEQITFAPTFTAWQRAARQALHDGVEPGAIHWQELDDAQPALAMFSEEDVRGTAQPRNFRVPRTFLEIARRVACHRDPQRWALLYRTLFRLTHDGPHLLVVTVDPDVHRLTQMDKAIRHDVHKMRAFVRFRAVAAEDGEPWYVAWFEPAHHIVELNAPFFTDRFGSMRWSILTPDRCVHWDGERVQFTAGLTRADAPKDDAIEPLWRQYYAHIFNPARVKIHAMQAEMPKRYWKNLPEADLIPALIREAPARVEKMVARSKSNHPADSEWHPAQPPDTRELATLREAAAACTACPLYKNATQTVFGEGPGNADVVFVGEQPGDAEDREGHPFVGPAGQLLDRALVEAGIDRAKIYLTNSVKHFKWEPRGKRRIHQTPNSRDIAACKPWLAAELLVLKPRVLVALGSTAAKTLLGSGVRVLSDRGKIFSSEYCAQTVITVHPSSLLRAPDEAARAEAYALFLRDLRYCATLIDSR
ncbi:MAG: UdgX family uracil-DNA binding protein [Chthoniobacteraceae bacterium]